MIRFDKVGYRVGDAEILRDIDWVANRGEVCAIIGPNGAGKSTLLALASGDFAPSRGRIYFDERDMAAHTDAELALERAVLRQSSVLSFAFTVHDIVMMGRSARAVSGPQDSALADRALAEVDLEHLRDRSFPTLSGGEKQRVHLARALSQIGLGDEGKALLLDEPTDALDPGHQHRVLSTARRVAAKGLAVVAVLHDPNLAAQYSDRVVVLSKGSVAASGTPREVLTEAMFREVFAVEAHVSRAAWNAELPWIAIVGPAPRDGSSPSR